MEEVGETNKAAERFGWSVNDWSHATGISRSSTYELIAAEKIETTKFGFKRIIITHPRAFLASLKGAA